MILLRGLEPAFRRIVAEEGFTATDGAIGVLATGTLDAAKLASLLAHLPPGDWELVTHPGYNDADLQNAGTRLLASRDLEREALLALILSPATSSSPLPPCTPPRSRSSEPARSSTPLLASTASSPLARASNARQAKSSP